MWGNTFAWKVVGIFMSWAFVFLLIPSKVFKGPVTSFGYVPLYSDNGFFYYITSIAAVFILWYFSFKQFQKNKAHKNLKFVIGIQQFIGLHLVYPHLSVDLYTNIPDILGSMNVFAFVLCSLLLIMGKWRPQSKEKIARYDISQTCYYIHIIFLFAAMLQSKSFDYTGITYTSDDASEQQCHICKWAIILVHQFEISIRRLCHWPVVKMVPFKT